MKSPRDAVEDIQARVNDLNSMVDLLRQAEVIGAPRGPSLELCMNLAARVYGALRRHEILYGTSTLAPTGLLNVKQ